MYNFGCSPAIAVTAALLLWPSLLLSQDAALPEHSGAESQFSAIHTYLAAAADTALEAAAAAASANPTMSLGSLKLEPDLPSPNFVPEAQPHRSRSFDSVRALVQPILAREGVPDSLAAVVLVESAGNPLALSPKGARGLWQLMPDTARRYGLLVDQHTDERLDPQKATAAAARYFRDLYSRFGSWPLALAAYNTGEQNLQRAIDRAQSTDFASLSAVGFLPRETRNYVPAVLAAMGSRYPLARRMPLQSNPARVLFAASEP